MEAFDVLESAQKALNLKNFIKITDGVTVDFGSRNQTVSFALLVVNESDRDAKILDVHCFHGSIRRRQVDDEKYIGLWVDAHGILALNFDVERQKNKENWSTRIKIKFNGFSIYRSIKINYNLPKKDDWDIPVPINDVFLAKNMTYSQRINAFEEIIWAPEKINHDNYAEHFHGLLWLEETGQIQSLGRYTQRRIHLQKAERPDGAYKMGMDMDLFEARPSLQIGKFKYSVFYFCARRKSNKTNSIITQVILRLLVKCLN